MKASERRLLEFGRRIYHLMLQRGWNQSDLARETGLPRDVVSALIRAKTAPTEELERLAKAFGVQPDELLPSSVISFPLHHATLDLHYHTLRHDVFVRRAVQRHRLGLALPQCSQTSAALISASVRSRVFRLKLENW